MTLDAVEAMDGSDMEADVAELNREEELLLRAKQEVGDFGELLREKSLVKALEGFSLEDEAAAAETAADCAAL